MLLFRRKAAKAFGLNAKALQKDDPLFRLCVAVDFFPSNIASRTDIVKLFDRRVGS